MEIIARDVKQVFSQTLMEICRDDPHVLAVSCVPPDEACLEEFSKEYPNRYMETNADGKNIIGVCSALLERGFIPVVFADAHFLSVRCYEQLRCAGYERLNIKFVGVSSGLAHARDGHNAHAVEDISLMRSVPHMAILNPGDAFEVGHCLKEAIRARGQVYIRMPFRLAEIDVEDAHRIFGIGKSEILSWGDVMLIAGGSVLQEACQAANRLRQDGMSVGMINVCSIKPMDSKPMLKAAKSCKIIFTIEEHSVVGGLGGEAAELLSSITGKCPHYIIGIPQGARKKGTYDQLLEAYGLTADQLYQYIRHSF
ncbi:MAG: transketolase family protein [Christensenellales bacterium]